MNDRVTTALGALLTIVLLAGVAGVVGLFTALVKTSGGEIAVVRNGGWLDDNQVRQVIDPSSGVTYAGMWSQVHRYPAQQRFYTITSDPGGGDKPGVDYISVPSRDGVQIAVEGTFYFSLTRDHPSLSTFDDKFGTRQFQGADGQFRDTWDGDDGWSSFLDQIVSPVIENSLRQQVGNYRCADIVSSCALVQNQGATAAPAQAANNENIARIQAAVNKQFADDVRGTLGGDYLVDIRFNLSRVRLPDPVQQGIDRAQAAFAGVSEAQAKVAQARADAEANRARQAGYTICPACAQIDVTRALPPGITVYAPGAQPAVPLIPGPQEVTR